MNRQIRQQFPALQQRMMGYPLCYLDNASTTQKPVAVITALQQYYRRDNANVHRAGYQLAVNATLQFEQARSDVAAYFGASPQQLIWTKGCTEAINLVAYGWAQYHLSSSDRILVSGLEHHANLLPWQQIARLTGASLDIIPVLSSGELDRATYETQLALQPKLVAICHVSNVLGTVNPIEKMIELAHQHGAKVLVDGAQSAAHLDIDFNQLGADFYAFSGHKMYGPTGIGGLIARKELLEQFEPWQTGGEMVAEASYQHASWAPLPYRLEAGTPNIAGAIGLAKAVAFINQLDGSWRQQEIELLAYARDKLTELPFIQLIGSPSSQVAVQSFVSTQLPNSDVAAYLDQQGVAIRLGRHCAHPLLEALGQEASLRLSLACYSNQQDIDQLIAALNLAHEGHVALINSSGVPKELNQIVNELNLRHSWQDRLTFLIELGRDLPEALKAERVPAYWIQGCESQTWLQLDRNNEAFSCKVESESNVIRGLLHVLALAFNAQSLEEQQQFNGEQWLKTTGLLAQLSTTRSQGMQAILQRLEQLSR